MSILSQAKPLPYWIVSMCKRGHLSAPVFDPALVPTRCPECEGN